MIAAAGDTAPRQPEWPRKCSCGESWTEQQWSELPSDGRYDAGREGWLELRACVCGARLAIPCDPPSKR